MTRQLLGRKDESSLGNGLRGVLVGGVEGKYRERAVDFDRLGLFLRVEHDPPAEAANRWAARLAKHGVVPDLRHAVGHLRFVVR